LVLPFWYRLTRKVLEKEPLNGRVFYPISFVAFSAVAFGALTLLVGKQEGHPACKILSGEVLAWLSVWTEVQLMLLPVTVSCFSKIQIGFNFDHYFY